MKLGVNEFIRNKINQILEPIYERLNSIEKNQSELIDRIEKDEQKINELSSKVDIINDLTLNVKNNNDAIDMIGRNLDNINPVMEGVEKSIGEIQLLKDKTDMLGIKLERLKKQGRTSEEKCSSTEKEISVVHINENEKDTYNSIDYFDFENYFRGSREHIKNTQRIYLSYFQNCKNVVDIGCGRGEFLELLQENQIEAIGVDCYDEFVDYCCSKGLNAVCGDAIEYLERSEEVDGIFAGQLVEHLQTEQVIRLCKVAYEKLKAGGYAIFETPNPTSLAIYTNSFYIDPSHVKPVHPLTLKYFMEKAGFRDIKILYTESSKLDVTIPAIGDEKNEEFNRAMQVVQSTLFGSQDYAIIARR